MKTSQEKYHEDQTNVEDDEEGWNDCYIFWVCSLRNGSVNI